MLKDPSFKSTVTHREGSDHNTHLHLYRSLFVLNMIMEQLFSGCARKTYPQILDTIQNQGVIGTFRTSPVAGVYVQANDLPLSVGRERLSL